MAESCSYAPNQPLGDSGLVYFPRILFFPLFLCFNTFMRHFRIEFGLYGFQLKCLPAAVAPIFFAFCVMPVFFSR